LNTMQKLNEKVILTDCDGVLLDWSYHFQKFMKWKGYTLVNGNAYSVKEQYGFETKAEARAMTSEFNNSAYVRYMTPHRDAIKYIKKLHEEAGYVFHVITSMSTNPYAYKARLENLNDLFGKNVIEKLICLDTGADKDETLAEYKDTGCLWVEDKFENALVGHKLGLDSVLMDFEHNKNDNHPEILRVRNWEDIYHYTV
jgi:FMN phosphatase YigB (HAD superfamily)